MFLEENCSTLTSIYLYIYVRKKKRIKVDCMSKEVARGNDKLFTRGCTILGSNWLLNIEGQKLIG